VIFGFLSIIVCSIFNLIYFLNKVKYKKIVFVIPGIATTIISVLITVFIFDFVGVFLFISYGLLNLLLGLIWYYKTSKL